MKKISIILFLILSMISASKAELTWYTTRASAVAKAKEEGKMVLLVFGRTTCYNTNTTKAQMEKAGIQSILNTSFILWWCDANNLSSKEESLVYWRELGTITLPLLCVIDPATPMVYKVRSTGILYEDGLNKLLSPYIKKEEVVEPAVEKMTISKSENEPLFSWLSTNKSIWDANGIKIKESNDTIIIENSDKLANITKLDISNSQQTNIDSLLARMTNLKSLNCENNLLDSINISNNTALEELYCDSNRFSTLNISNCTNLTDSNKFIMCPQEYEMDSIIATDSQRVALASQLTCFIQPKFEILIDTTVLNGIITVSQTEAAEGTEIKLSVTPLLNYELQQGSLFIYKTDEEDLTFPINEEDTTFIMPAYPITITATFESTVANENITENIEVWSNNKKIYFRTTDPENVYIFSLTGQLIRSAKISGGTTIISSIPEGLYILRIKNKAFKILVR